MCSRRATGHQPPQAAADREKTEPDTTDYVTVTLPDQHITITEILRHIEAGKVVVIIPPLPAPRTPDQSRNKTDPEP
jgi:hypothetical protein